MPATKTTFLLDDELREQLKILGARTGKSVTELLAEGARLVLARSRADGDKRILLARATSARRALRAGLYAGAHAADEADGLVYGQRTPRNNPRRKKRG